MNRSFEIGTLNPIVGREFPLANAQEAHEAVLAPGALGKDVLIPYRTGDYD
jgi:NADPH2:quinone reductase